MNVLLLAVVFVLFSFLMHSVWEVAFLVTLFFIGFNILEATLPGLISRTAPKADKGLALGIYNTTQSFGLFVGGAARSPSPADSMNKVKQFKFDRYNFAS